MLPDAQAFEVLQIKEKFGTLRFYWRLDDQSIMHADLHLPQGARRIAIAPDGASVLFTRIRLRATQAEKKSAEVCEICGAPGTLNTRGWWKVNRRSLTVAQTLTNKTFYEPKLIARHQRAHASLDPVVEQCASTDLQLEPHESPRPR